MTSHSAFVTAGFDATGTNFAAVYQGLDSHRLRVMSTTNSQHQTGREFVIDRTSKIRTLCWATLPQSDRSQPLKKRKKASEPNADSGDVVVLGTTQGTLLLYSPASGSIISTLKTGSAAPVCGVVAPSKPATKLFVLQIDGTLTEFDLNKYTLLASSVVPVQDPTALANHFPHFLIANTAPNLYRDNEVEVTFPGFATSIKQILTLGSKHFAAVAEEDRQVCVYDLGTTKPVTYLTCPSTNAVHISANSDSSVLAVTTEDGLVHVFENPTKPPATTETQSKRKGKSVVRLTPKFTIDVVLEKKHTQLPVYQTRFADNFIQLVWPEQGSVPVFDKVAYRSSDSNTIASDNIRLEKAPSAPLAREYLVGGVDPASVTAYDDSQAKVVSGDHVADLSDDETLADKLEALEVDLDNKQSSKSTSDGTQQSTTASSASASDARPSNAEAESRLRRKDLKLKLSQPGSFATLLNQSLTLNDKQLLEICLEEKDPAMIKTSIVKLAPSLAAALLEHLASTMAHSQNRSTTLTQWIRWVVVIHGGYLVTLPNLLKTLAALHSTLSSRAATLPRLLALQGRLELLEEQLSVRSEIAAALEDDEEDVPEAFYDEEEAIIVNGEEAYDDEDEEEGDDANDDEDEGSEADPFDDDEIMLSE